MNAAVVGHASVAEVERENVHARVNDDDDREVGNVEDALDHEKGKEGFLKISRFLERILVEHTESFCTGACGTVAKA